MDPKTNRAVLLAEILKLEVALLAEHGEDAITSLSTSLKFVGKMAMLGEDGETVILSKPAWVWNGVVDPSIWADPLFSPNYQDAGKNCPRHNKTLFSYDRLMVMRPSQKQKDLNADVYFLRAVSTLNGHAPTTKEKQGGWYGGKVGTAPLKVVALRASEVQEFDTGQEVLRKADTSPGWTKPKQRAETYTVAEAAKMQAKFDEGYKMGAKVLSEFQKDGHLRMISPFHKDGNREPLNNEERSLVDGFVSALGFSMHKYDLVEKLVALTKMRTDKGEKRFTFLPNEEELRGMSPAKLQDIPLRSAQVMLTETALVLPACQNNEKDYFSSIFQRGYDPKDKRISEQIIHAIESVFLPKGTPPESEFQEWLQDAEAKYSSSGQKKAAESEGGAMKKGKKRTAPAASETAPRWADLLASGDRDALMAAYLSQDSRVEYWPRTLSLNADVLKDSWASEKETLETLTTQGRNKDPGRYQCIVTPSSDPNHLRESDELEEHKAFLDLFANVMTGSLLLNVKRSAAGLYSEHLCDGQDMHMDLSKPPKCRRRYDKQNKTHLWTDKREIPGLLVLGPDTQKLRLIPGSHILNEMMPDDVDTHWDYTSLTRELGITAATRLKSLTVNIPAGYYILFLGYLLHGGGECSLTEGGWRLHMYSSNKDEGGVDLHTTFPKKIARSIAGVREPRRGPLSHLEAYMTVLAMINDVNIVNPGEASAEI